jgi:hypothetical protein
VIPLTIAVRTAGQDPDSAQQTSIADALRTRGRLHGSGQRALAEGVQAAQTTCAVLAMPRARTPEWLTGDFPEKDD